MTADAFPMPSIPGRNPLWMVSERTYEGGSARAAGLATNRSSTSLRSRGLPVFCPKAK